MSAVGDIQFEISGLGGITQSAISGIVVHYGVNMIPYANLGLNVAEVQRQEPQLLCNPDSYKSKSKIVTIKIKTKTGCIQFEGFLDGISFSQSPGGISYTAILKSKFQTLIDVYPRVFGLMPGSFKPYKTTEFVKSGNGQDKAVSTLGVNIGAEVSPELPVAEYVSKLIKYVVTSQQQPELTVNAQDGDYLKIVKHEKYTENLDKAFEFVNKNLDTSATRKCQITGVTTGEWLISLMLGDFPTLWDMMVAMYDEINCILVCGNDKIFVIPKAEFLKIKSHAVPPFRGKSKSPNKANPVDFNYLTISDTGYINARYCLNVIDPSTYAPIGGITGFITDKLGVYVADDTEVSDSAAGLITNKLSVFALNSLNYGPKPDSANGNAADSGDPPDSPQAAADQHEAVVNKMASTYDTQKDKLDQFAKLAFLSEKFRDRAGSFTMTFNPEWVPGSTGSIYTRVPGLFFQGFVTHVTHEVVVNIPDELKVVTTVNISCIRQAGTTGNMQGVEDDGFYYYTYYDMENYWDNWLNDITL
jgi:hypothetical protein